jgi:hypothetical protein
MHVYQVRRYGGVGRMGGYIMCTCSRANTCNGMPVVRVKGLVNLVKQIEWGGITLLNSKDETKSYE